MGNLLILESVAKYFKSGNSTVAAVRSVSFAVQENERIALVGPSGSGKSTLLSLAAGLDVPSEGRVILADHDLARLTEDERAKLRLRTIGFVFQSYQLIPTLTALENAALPAQLLGRSGEAEARQLLEMVGLGARVEHYPTQLSGGEQQRVALARAFINRPKLILADEPTGSLDRENAEAAITYMELLNREYGSALLLVTHDAEVSARMSRVITMRHGALLQ